MSQERDNLPAKNFSQSDRESMIAACWYVAYADGRLHREVKLMRSIADRLQVGHTVAQATKKRVAAGKLKPKAPVDIEARQFLLPLLLQVATNDGRLTVAEQSAVRRLGQLMKLDDEFIDEQISAIDTTEDRVKPLAAKRRSKHVTEPSTASAPSGDEMTAELERLVQPDQANVPAKASPIAALFMILLEA